MPDHSAYADGESNRALECSPMKRLVSTICGMALVTAFTSAAAAQITFIPGPQHLVPSGPALAAAADFDGDGIQDAVVSGIDAGMATVLFGSGDGAFRAASVELPIGQSIRGVAAADFNGDHKADVAVADLAGSQIVVVPGNGDGTFGSSSSIRLASGPGALFVANFDNQNGPDLLTVNSADHTLTVLLNRSTSGGFLVQPSVPVGENLRAVGTADFNGDGLADIAVVETSAHGGDEISILLNGGGGSFQPAASATSVGGDGAIALAAGDFNNDGAADIAVLNAGVTTINTFSVSVLLNQTEAQSNGELRGTGSFLAGPAFPITCPGRINGIPVLCTPQDITSADFDLDGSLDIAVSFSTRSTDNTSVTAGLVSAFAGRGDGSFDFGTQVIVGLGPRRMVAADFTGDSMPDIVLTEFGSSSVRVLRSVVPIPPPH